MKQVVIFFVGGIFGFFLLSGLIGVENLPKPGHGGLAGAVGALMFCFGGLVAVWVSENL